MAFFQRALAKADSLALPAALIFLLGFPFDFPLVPLILAHLALAAALILAMAARLIFRLF